MNDHFISIETGKYVDSIKDCVNHNFSTACYGLGIFTVHTDFGPFYYYGGDLFGYNSWYFHIPCLNISLSVAKTSNTDAYPFTRIDLLNDVARDMVNSEIYKEFWKNWI